VRILLDECINPRVRQAFAGHEVQTLTEVGWRAVPDAELVTRAQGLTDVLVTLDRGFEFEHNLSRLTFGIVIVQVARNRLEDYRALFSALASAAETVLAGEVIHVGR
jgi:predicted nuclease of predicted toxin-antitoxin system